MAKKTNSWLTFLKSWRARHKGESLKTSMKKASVEYRKSKGKTTEKKKRKK